MPLVPVENVGSVGIVTDLRPHELPPEAWSGGQNVRFHRNVVEKALGHVTVFDPPTVAPYGLLRVPQPLAYYWMYGGLIKVYVTDMAAHFNITRQTAGSDVDYSASADIGWNGGVLGGIPVINNGVDPPQMWNPVSTSQKLQLLTAWDPNWSARVIRTFKSFLVALDVTKSGTRFPHMVKWSHPADPGQVPSSWDETDPTKLAGETENPMKETGDLIVDGRTLGDVFIVYKERSMYGMQFIGGALVFRFWRIDTDGVGALTRNCVSSIPNGHLVLTNGDVVVHNGTNPQSIIDARRRNELFDTLDNNTYVRSFVVPLMKRQEVWICTPSLGSSFPNRALIWNWSTGAFGQTELPNGFSAIGHGVVDPGVDQTWDADSEVWDTDTSVWDARLYNPVVDSLLAAVPGTTKLLHLEQTSQFNGVNMTSYVERLGLTLVGQDRQGRPKLDMARIKHVRALWPRVEISPAGGKINVYAGSQNYPDGPVTYEGPKQFDPAVDQYVNFLNVSGPLIAVRFESTTNVNWKLHGYTLDLGLGGRARLT